MQVRRIFVGTLAIPAPHARRSRKTPHSAASVARRRRRNLRRLLAGIAEGTADCLPLEIRC
jgi:hypothetical protein